MTQVRVVSVGEGENPTVQFEIINVETEDVDAIVNNIKATSTELSKKKLQINIGKVTAKCSAGI